MHNCNTYCVYSLTNTDIKSFFFCMCTSYCSVSFPGLQPRCAVHHCPITIRSDPEYERRLRDPNLIRSGLFHLGGLWALERAKDGPGGGYLFPAVIGAWSHAAQRNLSAERWFRVTLEVQTDRRWISWGKWKLCLGVVKMERRGWGAMC